MSASASATAAGGRRGVTLADELQEALLSETSLVQPADPRSANVVILGTPNAGKSTLVNRLVRSKISAVSHKRNTTRTSVLGVATRNNRQLVLFDTPGVLPKLLSNKYQKELSTAAWDSAEGADVAVLIVDAVKKIGPAELELFEKAKRLAESNPDVQLVLLMNKMDLCKPSSRGRALAEQLQTLAPFARTLFTSVLRDKGVKELEDLLYNSCVEREWEYASGSVTDQSASERVIELVREKIFHRVHQEIPYRVAITNRGWTELSDGSLRIDLQLAVDTRHQKLILVGKGDTTLGFIKQRALPEIEQLLQRKVHLFLKCISKD
jgi:GTP-binding protein Era